MHEITFTQAQIWTTPSGHWLALEVDKNHLPTARRFVDSMSEGKSYTATLKQYKPKRSLDANAYFWVLVGKLAEKINLGVTEIYREYIKDIGGNYEVVCVQKKSADDLERHWTSNGLGWQVDSLESKIEGCVTMLLYYGSSQYDTAQMSRLIEQVVRDCKEHGIETKTPRELAEMLARWADAQKN